MSINSITLSNSLVRVSLMTLCVVSLSQVAKADTFNFYPANSSGNGDVGISETYTSGVHSITAYGFECDNRFGNATTCLSGNTLANGVDVNSANLYRKNDGLDERGLGLHHDPYDDHEISKYDFIDLDLTNLGASSGTLTISSLQVGESFKFCYGNSHSTWDSNSCSSYTGVTGNNLTVAFDLGAYHDISLIGVNTDVLLSSLSTASPAPAPEPASLALLGTGLLSAFGFARRRMQA